MVRKIAVAAGALAVAVPVARKLAARKGAGSARDDPRRWHVVTVNRAREDVAGRHDTPLAALGDEVEVELREAPGDRGTEIAARLRSADAGHDRVTELRAALRDTRQVLEVGWVSHPDRPVTTRPTPLNAPLRAATAHGKGEGRL